ncbi:MULTISPECIES: adenosine deaminase [unclassified Frigoribacterium]|jgi:adenosine deaminase|uniref:adenosine deaminase n=1 Tax=unclassified Frigoribacterium TaxID=2627005 RepID=UPI0017836CD2|nr:MULTISPECIES: adenosine deaminase [unclassified Frigoribacterium]MBD8584973.1 adenosine deaminase [Frigoribacterium sp. CFBP 8766]MBD8609731.1 adenosine deaminase [Frigoribacterium sp. CFBP 13729]MBF4578868.1 adenosine deaminase [Frigoribacterium sp. VKM Ac-2530]
MSAPDKDYRLPDGGPRIAPLPKVSLHDHLDGGLRPQTIVELADEIGYELPVTGGADELGRWFVDSADSGNLPDYLKTFDVTTAVMQTEAGLERVAREFVLDLAADGVVHGEVRWAPEQHLQGGLSLDQTVEAVQRGIEQAIDQLDGEGHVISVGQLVTAMRHADRGLEIAQLAIKHREAGVIGFDIAGAEAGFPASNQRPAFDLLAREFMPVTVHAGEADGLESIRSALLDGRALRLGHGVRLAEDIRVVASAGDQTTVELGPIAAWVRDREIALELSPQSNLQTGAIAAWGRDLDDHPFDLLYQLGYCVTVNTDNRLMSDTSLTKELALLAQAFDYGVSDLETFQLNAAASSFLPLEDREALADRITAGFGEV